MRLSLADGEEIVADAIVGADGKWSAVRRAVLDSLPARFFWPIAASAFSAPTPPARLACASSGWSAPLRGLMC